MTPLEVTNEPAMTTKIRTSLLIFFAFALVLTLININIVFDLAAYRYVMSQIGQSSFLKTTYVVLISTALAYLLIALLQISEMLKDINQRLEKIEKEPK